MLNKYYVSEQYLFDPASGVLHDLKGTKAPENRHCGFDTVKAPLLFDAKKIPPAGKACKIKTPGGKKKIVIGSYCPNCM